MISVTTDARSENCYIYSVNWFEKLISPMLRQIMKVVYSTGTTAVSRTRNILAGHNYHWSGGVINTDRSELRHIVEWPVAKPDRRLSHARHWIPRNINTMSQLANIKVHLRRIFAGCVRRSMAHTRVYVCASSVFSINNSYSLPHLWFIHDSNRAFSFVLHTRVHNTVVYNVFYWFYNYVCIVHSINLQLYTLLALTKCTY